MDSQQTPVDERSLRGSDYLLLLAMCVTLFGFSLITPRILTTHETVHCLNVREMFTSGKWLIPTYGGRPWLERPPLPHWMTAAGVAFFGDLGLERAYRIGSILIATLAVMVFAWSVAGCWGRTIGLMSGAILATMREFAAYAAGPEADIFLASVVTIAASLLMRALYDPRAKERRSGFLVGRSWLLVLFFALLGATNAMKGPLFGMIFVMLPLVGLWLWNRSLSELRPVIWLWGWLLTLVSGAAWPLLAYSRFPDILELWAMDYGLRWRSGYLGEPIWYYAVEQPLNAFPWTLPVFLGLITTARSAFRANKAHDGIRFLWCWTLLPVLFFSLFKGKHHHYMLSCLAPAAVFAAIGARVFWRYVQTWPNWVRRPWVSIAVAGVPGAILVYLLQAKLPGPGWVHVAWMVGFPITCFAAWWVIGRRQERLAFLGTCAVAIAVHCAVYEYRTRFAEDYAGDRVFIEEVRTTAADKPLLVLNEAHPHNHPLNASWLLFYVGEHAQILHNVTYLRDEKYSMPEVYVLCRASDEPTLTEYGNVRPVVQSKKTRFEKSPLDRYTLYELRFHPYLSRVPGNIRMTPIQATGRDKGPYLDRTLTDRAEK